MWLLSWIREGKQHKILFDNEVLAITHCKANKDVGMLIEFIPIFVPKDPAPKKESTSTRLIPLSDTIQKD